METKDTSYIKTNAWLTPLSWLYGMGVRLRNWFFDIGLLPQHSFPLPVISVGNLSVGGSGKTPHVEYLIRLLHERHKVAVLSRGYKRKSSGFVLATDHTPMPSIGDEPYQMRRKFPDVYVAVDKDRSHGIRRLMKDAQTKDVDVVLLDDAYQHRFVKRGLNILLMDFHRLVIYDRLLPAGRLREPKNSKNRADIVIITKCPEDLDPMDCMMTREMLDVRPYQKLFFTSIKYNSLRPFNSGPDLPLSSITHDHNILLVIGIALPQQLQTDLTKYTSKMRTIAYDDHHQFTPADVMHISRMYNRMMEPKLLITTEKDASRLSHLVETNYSIADHLYVLPIEVEFLQGKQSEFDNLVRTYVRNIQFNRRTSKKK